MGQGGGWERDPSPPGASVFETVRFPTQMCSAGMGARHFLCATGSVSLPPHPLPHPRFVANSLCHIFSQLLVTLPYMEILIT